MASLLIITGDWLIKTKQFTLWVVNLLCLHIKNIRFNFVLTMLSIQKHFLFSLGLTSMSDASSFRDAMLAKIVLAQY
jgi:hypothetical protein